MFFIHFYNIWQQFFITVSSRKIVTTVQWKVEQFVHIIMYVYMIYKLGYIILKYVF